MPSLLSDTAVRIAHYNIEINKDKEYPVATFIAAIQNVYLHDPLIINATEKPPSTHQDDRFRRVDCITHLCKLGSWNLHVRALWECKRPDAAPAEIEACESQVFDACERNLSEKSDGTCYGFSVIGSLWRVFKYTKPGKIYECITGEGAVTRDLYMDVSDESEAMLIDACLRELREDMKLSPDGIRPDAITAYPRPPATRDCLCLFQKLKREGWTYEPGKRQFKRQLANHTWETHLRVFPAGLK